MADQHYITQATADRTKLMGLGVKHNRYYQARKEGYFFDYVKQQLIERYGLDTVRHGGLHVYTTIDLKKQAAARAALDNAVAGTDRAGAIVTIDPQDRLHQRDGVLGEVRPVEVQPRRAGRPRQPGSTFKVMVLIDALRRGVDPESTTYVSKPLNPGWLPSAPDSRSRPTRTPTAAR